MPLPGWKDASSVSLVLTLFANSGFVLRILNIFQGSDSSINNRSSQAYFLALAIADLKSTVFGVGPGQLKLLGQDLISLVYAFSDQDTGQMARIPSSMAEILATFGWVGFFGKIVIEWVLFRTTRVKTSSFRLCLFIFMFIYQFVGSFSTNIVEIFFWVLAFAPVFPDAYFKRQLLKSSHGAPATGHQVHARAPELACAGASEDELTFLLQFNPDNPLCSHHESRKAMMRSISVNN